jgi:small ligand-binding sensory domain FIST
MIEFKSYISTRPEVSDAVGEIRDALKGFEADLAVVFASQTYGEGLEDLAAGIREHVQSRNMIGCSAEGVVGPDCEVERSPGVAVWAAKMPGVAILPFVIDQNDVTRFDNVEDWREYLGVEAGANPGFVVLADPYSIDVERCLGQLDASYEGSKTIGGLASGAAAAGENRLFSNDQVLRQGLVGVSLTGPVAIETVVSQGCRPIGEPFVVTKAERNVIFELRGKPAVEVIRSLYASSPPGDQSLMQGGLHVGRVVDERQAQFGQGDFLIRNLMGVVNDTAIAIGALVRPGQTIQFHVRDSKSADEDMRTLIEGQLSRMAQPPKGGLLFTCNGRGVRLFGSPHHDIGVVNKLAEACCVSGFFAAGEIGPVGNKTFVHGLTSSLVLFSDA